MANEQLNAVESVMERLIREGVVGEAVSLAGGDFFAKKLTDKERERLQGTDTWQLMEDLFFAQVRWLFEGPVAFSIEYIWLSRNYGRLLQRSR